MNRPSSGRRLTLVAAAASLLLLAGCGERQTTEPVASMADKPAMGGAAPLRVVSSFSILGDVARQIGGEQVEVLDIVGPGQDAHVYQVTPGDIRRLGEAQLVLMNGLGYEGAALERAVRDSQVPVAIASAGIETLAGGHAHDDEHDHDHGEAGAQHDAAARDPHVWQDPVLMQAYAANIAKAMIQADPAHQQGYEQRLADYQQILRDLDSWAAAEFASIPPEKRKVVTGHDAFAYLGQRYQLQFLAPQGVSTDSQPSARAVAGLISQIREQQVKAVFMENIKDPRLVEQISQEAGVTVQNQPLYSDALSPPEGPATSYVGLIRYNVTHLVQAMH
ncbi:metal ABC transporter solute-binding protein, Zn/Mn family [Brachymonas wangyanguii]|uniref:metal ABC transporter solute-binding protein, Zn/Mn family n=1 Tax=Brachymonas wangyanguii TaxID=3130163 RepID=UPI00307F7EFA